MHWLVDIRLRSAFVMHCGWKVQHDACEIGAFLSKSVKGNKTKNLFV